MRLLALTRQPHDPLADTGESAPFLPERLVELALLGRADERLVGIGGGIELLAALNDIGLDGGQALRIRGQDMSQQAGVVAAGQRIDLPATRTLGSQFRWMV
ncbi:hypothetical protein GCM10025880_50550 [Methylorubrum aminovorans]|nr:hypothetical protein GCM10025880_50550 [Methylorubrum aminovorans]